MQPTGPPAARTTLFVPPNAQVNTIMGTGLFANMLGDFTCRAPYALCAYANCSIVHGSKPLVAECGCWTSNDTLNKRAISVGTTPTVLDKDLMDANEKVGCVDVSRSYKYQM